jgi:protein-S-isoprenylcysteine O-methyltransferase Ste14
MLVQDLLAAAIIMGYTYLLLIIWSIIRPENRFWPPGDSRWKLILAWGVFYLAAGIALALIVLDWNSWGIPAAIRFGIGIPLALVGGGLVSWGIITLGLENTHGRRGGFITGGPYRFTRNPQYLGDIVLLTGLMLIANSVAVIVINLLIILSFILMPFAEEIWLEEQYGEAYLQFKARTPRFL